MIQFLSDNILLLLTLLGAVVSFLATFVGLVSKKKPVVILAVLAVLGFVVGIAYQLSSYSKQQEAERRAAAKAQIDEAATRARDNVIKEINFTVGQTKITVDAIAGRLSQLTLQQTAAELVTVKSGIGGEFDEAIAFAKGSSDMWKHYADWLESLNQTEGEPSLSLTLNAGHHYDTGLLLAYMLTSDVTRNELRDIIRQHDAWHTFTAETLYLQAFAQNSRHIKWILLYDGTGEEPVAYADAKMFAQELMAYHRLKRHRDVERALNSTSHNAVAALSAVFPSLRTEISRDKEPEQLVKTMIEKQRSEMIAAAGEKTYVARLERMIDLAASRESN
jgi:hypothetical protein